MLPVLNRSGSRFSAWIVTRSCTGRLRELEDVWEGPGRRRRAASMRSVTISPSRAEIRLHAGVPLLVGEHVAEGVRALDAGNAHRWVRPCGSCQYATRTASRLAIFLEAWAASSGGHETDVCRRAGFCQCTVTGHGQARAARFALRDDGA